MQVLSSPLLSQVQSFTGSSPVKGHEPEPSKPAPGDSLSIQVQRVVQNALPLPEQGGVTFDLPELNFNEIKRSKHVVKATSKALKNLGFKETGNMARQLSGGVGLVGHSGRAYDKFQKGQYLRASKESARAVKEGARLFKQTLPSPISHGLNGVVSVAVVHDFYKGLNALVEDPSYKNIHAFIDNTKLMLGNVDDVQEIALALMSYTKGQGPEAQEKLLKALDQADAELFSLAAQKSVDADLKNPESLGSVARVGSMVAVMVAGLDVVRALLAGVEVYQDPDNAQNVGQLLKRASVAVFSVAAVRQGAHWSHGLVSTGLEMMPTSIYDYFGQELLDTFDMSEYPTLDSPSLMVA